MLCPWLAVTSLFGVLALAEGFSEDKVAFLDAVTTFCYQSLLLDPSCCKDKVLRTGVRSREVLRPGAAWQCINPPKGYCLDIKTGLRGQDQLWWTDGADCSAPRILYVHGGNWTFHGPTQSSYDVLSSKIAKVTNAVVMVPDFRLVPIGNYTDTVLSLMDAWRWLGTHGPDGIDCSAAPAVPQFLGGDSSGAASALSLLIELQRGMRAGREGYGPPAAGFFGYSPWTNLACDTPTYYSEAFAIIKDLGGAEDYIGDILHPQGPRSKSRSFRELSTAYVGSAALLEDSVASPFHAAEEQLRGLPPMYFAISGTESMAGDSVILATKASNFGVPVAIDIFPGMWHGFPQYAEGCGAGKELWQAMTALMHTADFIRQIFAAAKNHPGRGFFVRDGSTPQMEFYYPYPTGSKPWSTVMPLTLLMGAVTASGDIDPPDNALVLPPVDFTGEEAVQGTRALASLRQLSELPIEADDVERCRNEDMTSVFFSGMLGGTALMAIGLACAWQYTSKKHGLCIRYHKDPEDLQTRSMMQSSGQEPNVTTPLPKGRYQALPGGPQPNNGELNKSPAPSTPFSSRGPLTPFWMRPGTAVRREIRSLPAAEQERFVKAVKQLMVNKDGKPQTSNYARLAGCHGWPRGQGHHSLETFPCWNRGHLVEFERALGQADKELGNDGSLALPYWDWHMGSVGRGQRGEVLPQVLKEHFPSIPEGLVDPEHAGLLGGVGYKLHRDQEVQQLLDSSCAVTEGLRAVATDVHWLMASRRWRGRGSTLEAVNDSVLAACGFPLSDLEYAAYHPLFFLMRCNLDRLYELHLQMFDQSVCSFDMEQHQKQQREERGEQDLFHRPLEPLRHPFEKRDLLPADCFCTQDLGYIYDELPPEPPVEPLRSERQREEPVHALFKLRPSSLKGKSCMLHVFAMPREQALSWRPPAGGPLEWHQDKSYAGCSGLQVRRSGADAASHTKPPVEVVVEVTQALKRQKLSRHETGLQVMLVDQLGEIHKGEEFDLAAPTLVGPLFQDASSSLRSGSSGGEVLQLQGRLARLGYDPGEMDGTFGPQTEKAVRLFQKIFLLPEDGVANKATKQLLVRQRIDLQHDFDELPLPRRLAPGATLRYAVHALPHNLQRLREGTLGEIAHAFGQWGEALGVTFALVEGGWRADLVVRFADLSPSGADYHGGLAVRGGQLSEVRAGKITLDSGEHWLLQRQDVPLRSPHAVHLYSVLLHAIGHYVGLSHSSSPQDVMWPFYRREDAPQVLSPNDVQLAQARLPAGGACKSQ